MSYYTQKLYINPFNAPHLPNKFLDIRIGVLSIWMNSYCMFATSYGGITTTVLFSQCGSGPNFWPKISKTGINLKYPLENKVQQGEESAVKYHLSPVPYQSIYRVYTVSCPAWYRTLRPHRVLACRHHRVYTASSEICNVALRYVLHATPKYVFPLRNMLCSRHMAPAKPTVCHRVVNFVRTVEHGEGTRRGVGRSVNTSVAR